VKKTLQDTLVDFITNVTLSKQLVAKESPSSLIRHYRKLIAKEVRENLENGTLEEYLKGFN
jgi:hypothetical protein